ncbi:PQQ-dependent sugar dehydrogenase [Saccharothrix sp. S26]|uniref:PQQ-dependent sugar dehydrogenase n=1 Tax=Saccharothrix sp. S26 TaxID=2907215 RepID=UPI001F38B32E|nr:PQQ-dependent sugar dehydrogenase [Saccharothrix sp. S26]MCE6998838.1 PQQ-dependent sugar dehydrogenase [Saccharothrix sp. S26]
MGHNATRSRPTRRAGRRRLSAATVAVATALSLLTASGAAHGLTDHQAEAADVSGGAVASEHTGFTGSGYVDYGDAAGGYVEYAVTAARAGRHALVFRYANGTDADLPLSLTVDGGRAGTASFPATGSWTTWREVTTTVGLREGVNRVRATAATARGGPNADRLVVDDTDTEPPTPPTRLRATGKSATSVSLAWDASTDDVGVVGYDVYQHGQLMTSVPGTTLAATVTGLRPDTAYDWTVVARDAAPNVSQAGDNVVVRTDAAPPGDQPAGSPSPSGDAVATPGVTSARGEPRPGAVTTLLDGADVPWGVAFLPDGTALVSERERFGIFRLTREGKRTDLGRVPGAQATEGEGGVLGVAVSPTFTFDHFVFVYHTAAAGNQVVRAQLVGDMLANWTTILGGMPKNRYHNGGGLRFSPDGRYLFVSTGDAQNGSYGQNLETNAGKILRLNPDGSIPPDNPFPGKAIWSYGHRNVQGLAFDSRGRLWATEFGNNSQDELNLIERGGNYGWPGCEGTAGYCEDSIAPKMTWPTSAGGPSGLAIIDDHLFIGTTVGKRVYRLRIDGSDAVDQQVYFHGEYGRLRTVVVDPEGDLWLTTTWDLDEEVGNDRVLHVDIEHPGS